MACLKMCAPARREDRRTNTGLLLVAALLGSAGAAALANAGPDTKDPASEFHTSQVRTPVEFDVSPGRKLLIRWPCGRLHLAGARHGKRVVGELSASAAASNSRVAQQSASSLSFSIEAPAEPDGPTTVTYKLKTVPKECRVSPSLELQIPAEYDVSVEAMDGEIYVHRNGFRVSVDSKNASVSLNDTEAPAEVRTTNGGVKIESPDALIHVSSENGSVRLECGAVVPADVTLKSELGAVYALLPKDSPLDVQVENQWGRNVRGNQDQADTYSVGFVQKESSWSETRMNGGPKVTIASRLGSTEVVFGPGRAARAKPTSLPAVEPSASETARVERLIAIIASTRATFLTADREREAAYAADRFRAHWKRVGGRLGSAESLIKVMTAESPSKPKFHEVRTADGKSTPAVIWFREALARADAGK